MNDEGLYTKIWGPGMWKSLFCITFNYPFNPTEKNKQDYFNYFLSLQNVLPCCSCRDNYSKHIKENDTKLSYDVFENRYTLTKWIYNLSKKVSNIIGFDYDITYDMFFKKYDSYIAKGDFNDEQKKNAFINYYDNHAPVVRKDILLCFSNYAKERGLSNFEENVIKYSSTKRESKEWYERNEKCQEHIKYMRINGIPSCERNGKYEGLPTIMELKLMEMTSSNLCKRDIKNILKEKFGCNFVKKYILHKY